MKRNIGLTALLAALTFCATLSGCGSTETSASDTTANTEVTAEAAAESDADKAEKDDDRPGDPPDGEKPDSKPDGEKPDGEKPDAPPDGKGGGGNPPGGGLGGSSADIDYTASVEISSADTQSGKTYNSSAADESALLISASDAVTIDSPTVTKAGDSDGGDRCSFYGVNAAVLAKDGANGQKKINAITRYVTVGLALITSFGYSMLLKNNGWLIKNATRINASGVEESYPNWFAMVVINAAFCAGAALVMWLSEMINDKGIGNGISIILLANIVSRLPSMAQSLWYGVIRGTFIKDQAVANVFIGVAISLVIVAAIQQMVYALIVLAVFIVVIIISFRMIARQMNRPIAELQATLERQVQAQKIPNDTAKDATTVLARVSEQWHAIDSLSDVRQMDTKLYEAVSANQLTENMLIHLSSFDHYVFLLCDVDEPNRRIVEARKLSPFLDYLLRYSLRELVGEG